METSPDPRQQLLDVERAAAAPYVDYPPTPAWYHPAVGAWAAGMVGVLNLQTEHSTAATITLVVLLAVEGAFFAWYRRKRGTMPSMRQVPPEIRREMSWYLVGLLVVVAVLLAASLLLPTAVTLLLTFLLVTGGVTVYERRYAKAAAATRARLA